MTNNFYKFSNGKTLVNSTPHPVRFQDANGDVVSIPNDPEYLINARVEEETVEENGVIFSRPTFVPTPEGAAIITRIHQEFPDGCIIIGSIVAAQAYPGEVCGMCPIPGHERVAPQDKLMRVDKFTRY